MANHPTTAPAAAPASRAEPGPRPRIPRHLGVIPDGNRRWAEERGLDRAAGYAAGVEPGLRLIERCRALGIEEVSAYGFTKENARRPSRQVAAFRRACVALAGRARESGAAVLVVGDAGSRSFPRELRPWAERRSPGDLRFNLLVDYSWHWDLRAGLARAGAAEGREVGNGTASPLPLASGRIPRVDLVVRWGGRSRLSGFLPFQCAYADLYVLESLWPDMALEDLDEAFRWYRRQDVTLGG